MPIFQLQIEHDVRNSVVFKFKDRFGQFLKVAHGNDTTIPKTLEELAEQTGIVPVVSGPNDKLGLARPWRVAVYTVGDIEAVRNTLCLLDGYFLKEARDEMPVQIFPHTGIDLTGVLEARACLFCQCVVSCVVRPSVECASNSAEALDYKYTELKQPASELPLPIFEAQPVKSSVLFMTVQIESETLVSLVFSGSTYPFRQKFADAGAPGGYTNPEGQSPEEKGQYLRTLKDIDVSIDSEKQRVIDLLSTSLNEICMRTSVDGKIEEDTAVSSFVAELKELPYLHFWEAEAA